MTERDYEADRAVCAAATEGPWEPDVDLQAVATERDLEPIAYSVANEPDARFIAEARQAWPYWMERCARAEALLGEAQGVLFDTRSWLSFVPEVTNVSIAPITPADSDVLALHREHLGDLLIRIDSALSVSDQEGTK